MIKNLSAEEQRELIVKGVLPPQKTAWPKIVAFDVEGVVGVIFHCEEGFIGLIDSCDVPAVNRFDISILRRESAEGHRLAGNAGSGASLVLAHIILALHGEYVNTIVFEVHHIKNVCDNRRSELQVVERFSTHPAKTHGTKNYIRDVLAELGYDSDAVLCAVAEMVKKPFADALSLDFRVNVR